MYTNDEYLCWTDSTQFVFDRSVLHSSTDPQQLTFQCVQLHEKWCSVFDTVREIYRNVDGTRL